MSTPPPRPPFSYRGDPKVPPFPDDKPIIIFDGRCVMCSGWAGFVLRRDRARRFRLLTAQSPLGRALYVHYGLDPDDFETNVLLEDGRIWLKSVGSLRMIAGFGWPWRAALAFKVLPRRLADRLYDWVARHRLDWFGARDTCYVPSAEDADRFVA